MSAPGGASHVPNRPLGVRVPEADRPAWERLLGLARELGVQEAERRLRGEPRGNPTAEQGPARPAGPERSWPEKRLLAALGHRAADLQEQAGAWLEEHGLPDIAENRVAALLDQLEAEVEATADDLQAAREERRALQEDGKEVRRGNDLLRGERAQLLAEVDAARFAAAGARANLGAARRKAERDWQTAYDRQLRQVRAEGYLPEELAGVAEAARLAGLDAAALPRLVAVIQRLGGTLQTLRRAEDDARTWETYLGHLRSEVGRLLAQARAEADDARVRAARERAALYTEARLDAGVPHLTLDELRRRCAALLPARSGATS